MRKVFFWLAPLIVLSFTTLGLSAILLFMSPATVAFPDSNPVEYKIVQLGDGVVVKRINDYGRDGWHIVHGRRISNGYEFVIQRTATEGQGP